MYKRILLALDLEGVNLIKGEEYKGLYAGCEEWDLARRQAAKEINAAAKALFDAGAEHVAVWDNHGGSANLLPETLDERVELIVDYRKRMSFASGRFDCICFFGYHAMEGTYGGVLAHTMSSAAFQYYKLNGKYIGEVDMDAYIAASHGMPSCFFAGGDIACRQAKNAVGGIVTVVTKTELARNEAIFRDNEELFKDIAEGIVEAVSAEHPVNELSFPAVLEKSFKRVEDAAKYLARLKELGISAEHPEDDILFKDAHTVVSTVNNIDEFISAI